MTVETKGRELFIVDNSISGWSGLRYLEEWTGIAKAFEAREARGVKVLGVITNRAAARGTDEYDDSSSRACDKAVTLRYCATEYSRWAKSSRRPDVRRSEAIL